MRGGGLEAKRIPAGCELPEIFPFIDIPPLRQNVAGDFPTSQCRRRPADDRRCAPGDVLENFPEKSRSGEPDEIISPVDGRADDGRTPLKCVKRFPDDRCGQVRDIRSDQHRLLIFFRESLRKSPSHSFPQIFAALGPVRMILAQPPANGSFGAGGMKAYDRRLIACRQHGEDVLNEAHVEIPRGAVSQIGGKPGFDLIFFRGFQEEKDRPRWVQGRNRLQWLVSFPLPEVFFELNSINL